MSNFKFLMWMTLMLTPGPVRFKDRQLTYARVQSAYRETSQTFLPELHQTTGNKHFHLYLRAFKAEQRLEAWIKPEGKLQYQIFRTYNFCATSGVLGPKRQEGDLQIPEGFYSVSNFNPMSNFYLSLGLNYPNRSDQLRGHPNSPGSAIYIHGGCATIGCIPITDEKIKELYVLAVEARSGGQTQIPVHIFPMRFSELRYATSPHQKFWQELQPIFEYFENKHELPNITIDNTGRYMMR